MPEPRRSFLWLYGPGGYEAWVRRTEAEQKLLTFGERVRVLWPWLTPTLVLCVGQAFVLGSMRTDLSMWLNSFLIPAMLLQGVGFYRLRPAIERAKERLVGGYCHGCGYDLRATPGRCPECGQSPAPPEPAAPPAPAGWGWLTWRRRYVVGLVGLVAVWLAVQLPLTLSNHRPARARAAEQALAAQAQAFAGRLGPALAADRRFRHVILLHQTAYFSGAVDLAGCVDTDADLAALRTVVAQSQLPPALTTKWDVSVIDLRPSPPPTPPFVMPAVGPPGEVSAAPGPDMPEPAPAAPRDPPPAAIQPPHRVRPPVTVWLSVPLPLPSPMRVLLPVEGPTVYEYD